MPITSTMAARLHTARPSQPSLPSLSRRGLWAWVLARLDACLSEPLRQGSPVELSRGRLLVGILGMLLLFDLLVLLFFLQVKPDLLPSSSVQVTCLVLFSATLWRLRQVTSLRGPALLLCFLVTAAIGAESLRTGSQAVAVNVMAMLVPMLTVYLLGVRWGLFFTLLTAVNIGFVHPYLFPPPETSALNLYSALFVLCGWLVSWMFLASRDEADAALEQALRTLRESEEKLLSLVESTDDPVCSLDVRGRILTLNQAGTELCRQLFGAAPLSGSSLFDALPPEQRTVWKERARRTLDGEHLRIQLKLTLEGRHRVMDINLSPLLGSERRPVGMTIFGRDITALKEAESRLGELHRNLLDVSRQAGMAEMANGILHNVGNTLNSVNVSAGLLAQRLRVLKMSGVARASALLREQAHDLASFFTRDPRGQQFPQYLELLSQHLNTEQEALLAEALRLEQSVEHIKAVVSMQQAHARVTGMVEQVSVPQLLDDAVRLHSASFEEVGIQVRTDYASPLPPVMVDRHKLLQILVNLVSNARHAVLDTRQPDKRICLRVERSPEGRLRIQVNDNGMGILAENMPRIFTQGFTTKEDGHGFGLHISALAAEELGGSLTCASPGPGQGATFTIELPFQGGEPQARGSQRAPRPGFSGTTQK
ncbi:PAS domain S-box-containing protein [Archangium gephyra]|uniref:histidine kinase n=2 Tax=Archangium gephyra TaxID=48 RepID=A0ABX9K2A8_9BACT|nr:ATP-binding protein [Archangium gephyra]REG31911.1 PAS domain S-box-containing protein [Archangium gephyra]